MNQNRVAFLAIINNQVLPFASPNTPHSTIGSTYLHEKLPFQ